MRQFQAYFCRGNHAFNYGNITLLKDFDGITISSHLGEIVKGYYLSIEQQKEKDKESLNYHILLYAPQNGYTNWTAFYTIEGFKNFCFAYGITPPEIKPGEDFQFELPKNNSKFQDINMQIRVFGSCPDNETPNAPIPVDFKIEYCFNRF